MRANTVFVSVYFGCVFECMRVQIRVTRLVIFNRVDVLSSELLFFFACLFQI